MLQWSEQGWTDAAVTANCTIPSCSSLHICLTATFACTAGPVAITSRGELDAAVPDGGHPAGAHLEAAAAACAGAHAAGFVPAHVLRRRGPGAVGGRPPGLHPEGTHISCRRCDRWAALCGSMLYAVLLCPCRVMTSWRRCTAPSRQPATSCMSFVKHGRRTWTPSCSRCRGFYRSYPTSQKSNCMLCFPVQHCLCLDHSGCDPADLSHLHRAAGSSSGRCRGAAADCTADGRRSPGGGRPQRHPQAQGAAFSTPTMPCYLAADQGPSAACTCLTSATNSKSHGSPNALHSSSLAGELQKIARGDAHDARAAAVPVVPWPPASQGRLGDCCSCLLNLSEISTTSMDLIKFQCLACHCRTSTCTDAPGI
jgi:hypothetical protein